MSTNGLPVFDTTVQKTNLWLHELMEDLDWAERHKAYQALRGVLQVLRDRLPLAEAVHLGSQLPMLVRGFYFEGWRPTAKPERSHSAQQFFDDVQVHFPNNADLDIERVVRAVFSLLADHIPGGEIEKIIAVLPKPLRQFWHEYHLET
jgi:uncharacterized protein (DUF2267 family)